MQLEEEDYCDSWYNQPHHCIAEVARDFQKDLPHSSELLDISSSRNDNTSQQMLLHGTNVADTRVLGDSICIPGTSTGSCEAETLGISEVEAAVRDAVPEKNIGTDTRRFLKRKIKRKPKKTILTKKRQRRESEWIDTQAKKARSEGKEGIGRKGPIQARAMKPGCSEKCRFDCHQKISIVDRKSAFSEYWSLGSKTKQWVCLNNWVPKKTSAKTDEDSLELEKLLPKANKIYYNFTLPSANGQISVCQKMFLDTLDISYRVIRTAKQKQEKVNSTGVMDSDSRGKHTNRPFRYPEELKNTVRDHINRFPVMESHYCRENSQRKYLEEGLSIAKMNRMYNAEMKEMSGMDTVEGKNQEREEKEDAEEESEEDEEQEENFEEGENEQEVNEKDGFEEERTEDNLYIASLNMYSNVFNSEFNLGFFKPKKDRCENCEAFKIMSQEDREKHEAAMSKHLLMKSEARRLMEYDKQRSISDNTVCTANYDMQKVLTTPRSEVSIMYYLSKLSVWNFTIFELGEAQGHSFIWNESLGNRGSNEIASYVLQFIRLKAETGTKEFQFYTDNCSGQNRNKNVFSMYIKASNELKVQITHRFLEVGHTQSEGDSMHARIENHCRGKSIFSQEGWIRSIRDSKIDKKYKVKAVDQRSILNFEPLADFFNWKAVKIASIREIKVMPENTNVNVKYDFFDEPKAIKILKRNKNLSDACSQSLAEAYNERISLSEKKKNDLKSMVRKGLIPSEYITEFEEVLKY